MRVLVFKGTCYHWVLFLTPIFGLLSVSHQNLSADKKALLLKDKYERLATSKSKPKTFSNPSDPSATAPAKTDSRALRKALDRRIKKNASREKNLGSRSCWKKRWSFKDDGKIVEKGIKKGKRETH